MEVAMDAGCCFCHWLLRTVLIILLHPYLEALGTTRECPQGQLLQVHTRQSYVTCCYPRRCGVGQQVAPCKINGTKDTCQMCGAFQNQSVRTSSFTMERCTDWPLDRNCKSVNNPGRPRDFKDEMTKRCMCNIEQGKKFALPEFAAPEAPMESYCQQRRNDPCQSGFEPQVDGGCVPCKNNYFKSTVGFNLCEPKTNCTRLGLEFTVISNASADNSCSEPELVVTTKSSHEYKPNTVVPVPKTTLVFTTHSSTIPTVATSTEHLLHLNTSLGFTRKQKNDNNILWPILGTVLLLVCVLVSIGVIVLCRRRGLCLLVCGKAVNDPEKTIQEQHAAKHSNGAVHAHHMANGDKMVNNNVNAAMPFDALNLSNGHANGSIPHEHLNPMEHRSEGLEQYTNPTQHQPVVVRPGILRASSRNGVFGQRGQGNMPDMISDLGPEKLRVNLVPNSNLGEGDCLLVSGYGRGTSYDDIQNWPYTSASPVQACVNSGQVLALNSSGQPRFGHIENNPFFPAVQPNGEPVIYSPAADTVFFTRSGSVITSPVDDVVEDAGARFPRFSQLLQDGEDASAAGSAETSIETCVFNPRIQHQDQTNNPQPQQLSVGFEPALSGSHQRGQPDHYIMDLKEQDIVDSEQSSSISANSNTELKTVGKDFREASAALSDVSPPTEQKMVIPRIDRPVDASAGTKVKTDKATEFKQLNTDVRSHGFGENKRYIIGGENKRTSNENKNIQSEKPLKNSADVTRSPNGDSNQNIRHRHPAGDSSELKSCVKNSSSKEHDSDKEKLCRFNRMVSFEENNAQTGIKNPDPKAHPRQFPRPQNSSEKTDSGPVNMGPLRAVSDTEPCHTGEGAGVVDATEWRNVHQKPAVPNSHIKASVNGNVSSTEDSCNSSFNSVIYRRSQSHNTSTGSESAHKPPPRSMSEDKQHKTDRPIAKVKPMPASDTCVNQLQTEATADAAAASPDLGANSHISSSNEDAGPDPQHNTEERYSSTLVLEGYRDSTEEELEENGV